MQKFLNNKTLPYMDIVRKIFKNKDIIKNLSDAASLGNDQKSKQLNEFGEIIRISPEDYFTNTEDKYELAKFIYTFEKLKDSLAREKEEELDHHFFSAPSEIITKIQKQLIEEEEQKRSMKLKHSDWFRGR